jgi:fatty acid desaturase
MFDSVRTFSMAVAKKIVEDLFEPNPRIYWVDFLLNTLLGWAALVGAVLAPTGSLLQIAAFILAVLGLYRSVIFIHELAHLKKDSFPVFRVVWNLLCGFPLMVPSFTYMGVHIDHHKQKLYGTQEDGEYLPFVVVGRFRIILFLIMMAVAPAFVAFRFLILTPLSYVIPPLRKLLWQRMSSLVIDSTYVRPEATERDGRDWQWQEFFTFLYALSAAVLLWKGLLPWKAFWVWYAVAGSILFVNGVRTLVAHCYRNPADHVLEFSEQFLDSVTVPGLDFITPLWAPVGLRFHAVHHLFPGMPYHNLAKAHRRFLKELPADSSYHLTLRKGLVDALGRLWKETMEHQQRQKNKNESLEPQMHTDTHG